MEQLRGTGSVVSRLVPIFGLVFFLTLTGLYIYYLRTGAAKEWVASILHMGFWGDFLGVFLQTIVNTLPVPGEFISILLIGVYGPIKGGFFSWVGGTCGAALAYFLSNRVARPFIEPLTRPYLEKVNRWLKKRGELGLLLIRFIPFIPYHFVNYAAGILGVRFRSFLWTTAIGILPYTITMSCLFAGLRYGRIIPFILGGVIFILSVLISIFLRKNIEPHSTS